VATRSESFDKAIKDVDRLEGAGARLPAAESSKLISQAHQNELERCILELGITKAGNGYQCHQNNPAALGLWKQLFKQ
jgi:hypothetical protein